MLADMKYHKKFMLLLTCIFAFMSIFFIIKTFSKYATAADGTASIPIARWNIIINNMSIKNNPNISSTLSPIFPGNAHIAKNVLAPTSEGYFDLVFDYSNVDVSFAYNISMSPNSNSTVKDLVAKGYCLDSGSIISFDVSNSNISGQINYTDPVRTRTIRVYIMWDDSENAVMNNLEDAQATTVPGSAGLIDVSISFTQTT